MTQIPTTHTDINTDNTINAILATHRVMIMIPTIKTSHHINNESNNHKHTTHNNDNINNTIIVTRIMKTTPHITTPKHINNNASKPTDKQHMLLIIVITATTQY